MSATRVCGIDGLPDGGMRLAEAGGREIGVYRRGGAYFAYENVCPHQGGPACEGVMKPAVRDVIEPGGVYRGQAYDADEMHIVCPWHGYEFRLRDGRHPGRDETGLRRFEAYARDGAVYVVVDG
ncbi:MAG TPA: Rieske 2Fe-2S domain-containing protein [Beijerinckiaceae bacterium]|jgi:nitrite reductase/ring-hydroxylating ferredoxin subunit